MPGPPIYGRGGTVGNSTTCISPSGDRSRVGAYSPTSSRRHHMPVARFSASLVNQYCQSTTRICRGGLSGKGSRSLESRCVQPHFLPPPPHAGRSLLGELGKPVLPEHDTNLSRRFVGEGISSEQPEHIRVVGKQSHLSVGHNGIIAPRA